MSKLVKFIPNLLTLGNAAMGALGIVLVAKEEMVLAIVCIGVALILDFFDGFVARLVGAEGKLGAELDSLADMITFGALPGLIMFQMISIGRGIYFLDVSQWTTADFLHCSIALFIPMAGAYRLAVFNLDEVKRPHFLGLPIPAMCMAVIGIPLVLEAHYHLNFYYLLSDSFIDIIGAERNWDASDYWVVKLLFNSHFHQMLSIFLAAMMVSRIPMLSLKFKGVSWQQNKWRYGLIIWALVSYLVFLIPYTNFLPFEIGLIDYLILPIFMIGYFVLSWIYAIFGVSKSDTKSNEVQS